MSWRTVLISNRSKLDLQLNHLVVRSAERKTKVFIKEIAILIVESTAVSITAALLNELTKNKVKIVFCDEKRNPISELIPYYGSFDTSAKINEQFCWSVIMKKKVWSEIVKEKILLQAMHLETVGKEEYKTLLDYASEIVLGDVSNREGHAAKVYFNALFGKDFSRGQDNAINASLNYGYSILLSAINREININGYLTQIGLFHRGKTNPFNLASDLIEPWRPIIDRFVYKTNPKELSSQIKFELVDLLNDRIIINQQLHTVLNGLKIYCKSVFTALNEEDLKLIRMYRNV